MIARRPILALGAAAALLAAAPAPGQKVIGGFPRVNQSDVSGTAVTSADMLNFQPGTVQSVTCAAAWGVRTEGRRLNEDFAFARLADSARALAPAAQADVARLLAGGPAADSAEARVRAALAPPSRARPAARSAAGELVRRLNGLLLSVGRMNPASPGRDAATRLYRASGAWDDYLDASSDAFLAAPPDEALAIHAVLSRLRAAAAAHAGRVGDPRQADEYGLVCAVASTTVVVEETPFSVCALVDGDFREVGGVLLPATGDSLAVAADGRVPFRQAYPDTAGYGAGRDWFGRDLPIVVGGNEYRQWGTERAAAPGELVPTGRFRGVTLFVDPSAATPSETVYLPSSPACTVQPYRRVVEIQRVRG